MTPIVIGLDLSLTGTGVASTAGWTDVIRPAAKQRGHYRLQHIKATILELIPADVALVVVEGPSYGSQAGQAGHHERAGLWWLVTHSLWKTDVPFAVASPTARAKYATGKGNAGKADVVRETTRRFDWFTGGEDEADALVLAAMGADWLGHPLAPLPATHRQALDKVQWPEGLNVPATEDPLRPFRDERLPRGVTVDTITATEAL
jgi:Holliday junction resolvasome RuvABC endonuclease subunit